MDQKVSTPPPQNEEEELNVPEMENEYDDVRFSPLVSRAIDSKDVYFWTREEFEQLMDDLRLLYNKVTRDRQRLKNEFRTIEHNIEEHERHNIIHPAKRRKKMKLSDQPNPDPAPINLGPPPCGYKNTDGSSCGKIGFCPFHDHKKKNSFLHPMAYFNSRKRNHEKKDGEGDSGEDDHVRLLLMAAEAIEKEGGVKMKMEDEEEDVIQSEKENF